MKSIIINSIIMQVMTIVEAIQRFYESRRRLWRETANNSFNEKERVE